MLPYEHVDSFQSLLDVRQLGLEAQFLAVHISFHELVLRVQLGHLALHIFASILLHEVLNVVL